MIFNGGLVRFWRAPPGRMDLIWTWPEEGCFTPRGVPTWRGLAPVAVGGFKREGSLQAGSGGGAEEGGRAGPTPAFVYCFARGRRRGTSADVTPGAPLATNLHRTTRLLRIKYEVQIYPSLGQLFSPLFLPRTRPVNLVQWGHVLVHQEIDRSWRRHHFYRSLLALVLLND